MKQKWVDSDKLEEILLTALENNNLVMMEHRRNNTFDSEGIFLARKHTKDRTLILYALSVLEIEARPSNALSCAEGEK